MDATYPIKIMKPLPQRSADVAKRNPGTVAGKSTASADPLDFILFGLRLLFHVKRVHAAGKILAQCKLGMRFVRLNAAEGGESPLGPASVLIQPGRLAKNI